MAATGITHVSVHANNFEESVRFYREVFGMEEVPSPDFPFPVRWLQVGEVQLHLFQSAAAAPATHHFGLDVDDLEAVYARAQERGALEGSGYFSRVYSLPDGAAQLYLRDPAGNLVEANYPDAAVLDRSVVGEVKDIPAKSGQASDTRLYPL